MTGGRLFTKKAPLQVYGNLTLVLFLWFSIFWGFECCHNMYEKLTSLKVPLDKLKWSIKKYEYRLTKLCCTLLVLCISTWVKLFLSPISFFGYRDCRVIHHWIYMIANRTSCQIDWKYLVSQYRVFLSQYSKGVIVLQ